MQIDNGWAACNPIFVAVEADDHNTAKTSPETNNKIPFLIYN